MKQLKIDEKEALKLYKEASKEFKIVLENTFGKEYFNQDVTDKVYDINSLCEYLEIEEDELFIFPKNTKNKHERMINACNILPKIAKIYNEGIVLDWNNIDKYKYLPYLSFSGSGGAGVTSGGWFYYLHDPGEFYYISNEKSLKAYKNFKSYFEDYWGNKESKF